MTLPLPAQGVQVGDPGHVSDHNAIANFLQQAAQSGTLGTSAPYMPYNVRTYGAIGNGVTDDTAAIKAAFQAAENNGGRKVVYFPTGTYAIAGTLSLSGYSSSMVGDGCQNSSAKIGGTVLKAISQTGPVLDFTGYQWSDLGGQTIITGFSVFGDGTSDPTQAKAGILINGALNADFSNIVVGTTGGPPLKISSSSYCSFTRMTFTNPLGATANDVQYLQANSIMGCRFADLLFHSSASTGDVGASGVVLVRDASGSASSSNNVFTDLLFDSLHVPTGGSLIWHSGNTSLFDSMQFAGCVKASTAATATAYIRLSAPSTNSGGNTVSGVIPGKGTGTTDIDTGVDINQSRNTVVGIKGFRGTNVTLESGVGFTNVVLRGGTGAATDAGVLDNSGQLTNSLSDEYLGIDQNLNYTLTPRPTSPGGAGVQISDSSNAQLGALYLGNQGPAVQNGSSQQKSLYYTGDNHFFRDSTKALNPMVLSSVSGNPSALFTSSGSNPLAASFAGNAGFATDNANDLGAPAANRPRNVYVGTSLQAPQATVTSPTGATTTPATVDATNTSSKTALALVGGSLLTPDTGAIILRKLYTTLSKTANIGAAAGIYDTITISSLVTAGLVANRVYEIRGMFNIFLNNPGTQSANPAGFGRIVINTIAGSTATQLKLSDNMINVGNSTITVPIHWIGLGSALVGQTSLQVTFSCPGNLSSGTVQCAGSATNPNILILQDVGDSSVYTVV